MVSLRYFTASPFTSDGKSFPFLRWEVRLRVRYVAGCPTIQLFVGTAETAERRTGAWLWLSGKRKSLNGFFGGEHSAVRGEL
jgi:hypothetical protein